MQTDSTVDMLQKVTAYLGLKIHAFAKNICPLYHTKELPREVTACHHCRAEKNSCKSSHRKVANETVMNMAMTEGAIEDAEDNSTDAKCKHKTFNLITYKLHVLGDYVHQILWFGTTDSYSTQPVSLVQPQIVVYHHD